MRLVEVTYTPEAPCSFESAQRVFRQLTNAFQLRSVGFGGIDAVWSAILEMPDDRAMDICMILDNTTLFSTAQAD